MSEKLLSQYNLLEKNNDTLSSVINSMPSALILVNHNGSIQLWNKEAEKLSGIPLELGHPSDLRKAFSHITDFMPAINEVGQTREIKKIEKISPSTRENQEYYDVMIYPVLSKQKEIREMVLRIDSITERVMLEESIIQNEKLASLGRLVASIAHEINTPLGAVNSAAGNIKNMLGSLSDQIKDSIKNMTYEHVEECFKLLGNIDITRVRFGKEERDLRRDLKKRLLELNIHSSDNLGDLLAKIGFYGDITPHKELLLHPSAERSLKFLFTLVSLDRNCFNISLAVVRASKIVYALKSYNHFSSENLPVATSISDSIDLVLTLYQNQIKKDIQVKREYEEIPLIDCFPDELNQVWTNIIHNALSAMNNTGTLTIAVKSQNEYIAISITDSGPGIPNEIKERIFLPFFTTKPQGEGSGLGLSITKKIIDKHKGKITVESQPGNTTFTILLHKVLPV
jgi:signal transduction histidine kinase